MRIAFMGTPDFAVPSLDVLAAAGHEIVAVYTQPPRPAGRGKASLASPVQKRAELLGLVVRTPLNFREPFDREAFAALDLDVAVVAAYGLILPLAVLNAPRLGCLNVHASLLPRWRGAAPIQRAILAGDEETGVTIMQMEKGLDTGPTLMARATPIDRKDAGQLTVELSGMGARMMAEVLADIVAYPPVVQPGGSTYAPKIDKAEARLDFTVAARQVERQVRAFAPVPGAFFEAGGERVRVLSAEVIDAAGVPGSVLDERLTIACGEGAIRPVRVQRAGKSVMATADLLRGFAVAAGTRLA